MRGSCRRHGALRGYEAAAHSGQIWRLPAPSPRPSPGGRGSRKGLAWVCLVRYATGMSRAPIATIAGLLFVFLYIIAVITLPDLIPRLHWTLEALYWLVAGIVWVFPVRWLMLWSVGKR